MKINSGFNTRKRILASIVISGFSLMVGLTAGQAQTPDRPTEGKDTLPTAYWDAVEDARIPEPQEVFRNLTAITPYNNTLSWDKSSRVLVTTWTTWNGYTQNVGNQLILIRDLWVTAVPDLQNFCKHYTPTPKITLAARLNQVLGLPPETAARAASRQIVEIWVDPKFLFRPSPDPEITDHEAELSFRGSSEFISVPLSYQHWFYAQYDQRYQSNGQPITRNNVDTASPPYPWTQLGYTYDWGNLADWASIDSNRPKHVGLSLDFSHLKGGVRSLKGSCFRTSYPQKSDYGSELSLSSPTINPHELGKA